MTFRGSEVPRVESGKALLTACLAERMKIFGPEAVRLVSLPDDVIRKRTLTLPCIPLF